jgi:hypothetical protein
MAPAGIAPAGMAIEGFTEGHGGESG